MKAGKLRLWQDLDRYTLVEAALLISENYPDDFTNTVKLFENPPDDFLPIYKKLLSASVDEIGVVESQEYEGEYYTEYRLNTDKPTKIKEIELNDGCKTHVTKVELLKYVRTYNITAKFLTDEALTEFGNDKETTPLPTKESSRKSDNLLRALAAIAMDAYGYIPNSEKSTAPKDIAKALSDKGASLDEKTIRKYLREGAVLLETKTDKS